MNTRLEIHPGEGGDDAASFAEEMAQAIARSFGATIERGTRVVTVVGSSRL